MFATALLAASLGLNALGLVAAIAFVRRKGGWRYLKSKLVARGLVRDELLERDVAAYHRTKVELFAACPVAPGDVVFLGDSMTDMAPWHELFPGLPVKNRGIAGDTVGGVLARVEAVLAPAPRAIFLLVGANDLNQGADVAALLDTYGTLVARIQAGAPGTRLVVQSLLPMDPFRWGVRAEGAIEAFNAGLAKLAAERGVEFVDLGRQFLRDGRLDPALTHDGLHPNGAGYARWHAVIGERVAALAAGD